MVELLSRLGDKDVCLFAKIFPEQYSNSKFKLTDMGEKIRPVSEHEGRIIVFANSSGSSNNKFSDQVLH